MIYRYYISYVDGFQNNLAKVFSLKSISAILNFCSRTFPTSTPIPPPPPHTHKKKKKKTQILILCRIVKSNSLTPAAPNFKTGLALVKLLIFSTHSIKYIWYSPQKSKYPLFILTCHACSIYVYFVLFTCVHSCIIC